MSPGSNQGKRTVEVRIDLIPSHVTDLVFATCRAPTCHDHGRASVTRYAGSRQPKALGRLAYKLPGLVQVHRPPEHGHRCRVFRGFGEQLRGGADQSGT